ncbi:MAG: hypothetical protein KDK48_04085, partial [Chlamydiia bacterium]|nr:hypothetical protein [Chlamydiia bacterium]
SLLDAVEAARMKRELIDKADGDESIVTLTSTESFLIHTAPQLTDGAKVRLAQYAMEHFPGVFNLQGTANRVVAKYLLSYFIDRYMDEKGIEGVGEKQQVKELLDPIVEAVGAMAPLVQKHHSTERYLRLVKVLGDAVRSSEEDFDKAKVKAELLKAIGELIVEMQGYNEGLESMLSAVADIIKNE